MALQKTFTQTQAPFSGTLEIANAYWRVEQVIATKSEVQCVVTINKKDGDTIEQVTNKRYSFAPDLAGKNFIAQAYEHLKTLPEFAGATDC
jgi:hypothetical protein